MNYSITRVHGGTHDALAATYPPASHLIMRVHPVHHHAAPAHEVRLVRLPDAIVGQISHWPRYSRPLLDACKVPSWLHRAPQGHLWSYSRYPSAEGDRLDQDAAASMIVALGLRLPGIHWIVSAIVKFLRSFYMLSYPLVLFVF